MVFSYFHESTVGGHLGVRKAIQKIRAHFAWKGMDKEIEYKIRSCQICSRSKPAQNTRLGLLSSDVAERPMQKLLIDFVGTFPRSNTGNTAILVVVDAFSKFSWLIPLREATTKSTVKALKERIFSSFSVPEVIVSDNAQCFTSREFRNFCFASGIRHVATSPYHHQPFHAERLNKNLIATLIAYHSDTHNTWDHNLPWLQLAFNTADYKSTKSTPFAVIFPFRSGSPLLNRWKINELLPEKCNQLVLRERWNSVRQNLLKSRDLVERRYNQNRVPHTFRVGDLVFCKNHPVSRAGRGEAAKLMPRFRGPYKIATF
jgi:transposase InsO family protein